MARSCLFTCRLSAIFYFKNARVSGFTVRYLNLGKLSHQKTCQRHLASFSKTSHDFAGSQTRSNSSDSDSEDSDADEVGDLKLRILKAGLDFVPEHGWSKKSIALGANALGLSSSSHTLLGDGGADLVHYFNFVCKEQLEAYLGEQHSSSGAKKDIQNYIEDALAHRLQMVIPYASTWPEALALMVSPNQFPVDLKTLLDLVDTIWYHSGDHSLNLSWYSKRLSLATAYRMCELTLTQDKSADFADTFCFLQRRMENVMATNQLMHEVIDGTKDLSKIADGALLTARNLLGANRWFR